mmetsp:Transcript_17073/g.22998  ORF Transcript_17073/g.22998 Transcript_17073/m.22998 type:complete len:105 (+) Transcript_17073:205-519(+)
MPAGRQRSGSTRKEQRPKLLDMIGSSAKDFGTSLGLIDDDSNRIPQVGSKAYQKLRVSKLMDEDCISMRNEPIDPLETVEAMQFDVDAPDNGKRQVNKQATEGR